MAAQSIIATPQELIVVLNPRNWDYSEYLGTRAMLEAEGIIPQGTQWREGYFDIRWKDNNFSYWLSRERPPGAKGSRKRFIDCDWFCLRWELINGPSLFELRIIRKQKELEELTYRNSAKGHAEWLVQYDLRLKAEKDMQYQAFKSAIPGLVPIRKGRLAAKRIAHHHSA